MKILVLSDSHASLFHMRRLISQLQPEQAVHLGDHYDDGEALALENPHIRFHQVPGNCDRFRCAPDLPQTLCYDIGGVRFFMTHGHLHGVKSGPGHLLAEARKNGAQMVLYGHTHVAACFPYEGMWVMNPGSCGSGSGSAGLLEITDGKIVDCRILPLAEM